MPTYREMMRRQDSHPPGVAEPRPTPSPGPARGVPTNSLSPPGFLFRFGTNTLPLPVSPSHTPQWRAQPRLTLGE